MGLVVILSVLALAWLTIHQDTRGTWPVLADGVISFVLIFYLMILIIKQSDNSNSIDTPVVGAIAAVVAGACAIAFTLMECMQCCTSLRHYVIARMVWTIISAYLLVVVITQHLELLSAVDNWWPWFLIGIGVIFIVALIYRKCCWARDSDETPARAHRKHFAMYVIWLNLAMYITIYALYKRYSVFVVTSPGNWRMPEDMPIYYFWLWYILMVILHPCFLFVSNKLGCRGELPELPYTLVSPVQ